MQRATSVTQVWEERVLALLTELFQMVSAVGCRHGRDGHQRTCVPSQRVAEDLLSEIDLAVANASSQQLKMCLEQERADRTVGVSSAQQQAMVASIIWKVQVVPLEVWGGVCAVCQQH